MPWPLSQDYNEAIQDAQASFSDPELRAGEATTNALGMPMPRSGNFADVYEFNTPATGSKWAIKCFTRHVPGLRERYTEISAGLLEAKLPFAVDFQYLVQGIRIKGDWFPILKMRWVEGLLLNEFVRDNLDKPALLANLGLIWCRMAKRLREAGIAHADLQHGNVILVPGSKATSLAVKLIDYDGMFVPALASKKSGEVGHPNYQHPERLREGIYTAEVDRFPLLVVATALRALSIGGRELWLRYDNGDNLLFRETDLRAPGNSALFKELHAMADPQVRMLTEALQKSAEGPLDAVPKIDELLPEPKKAPVPEPVKPASALETAVTSAPILATPPASSPLDFTAPEAPRKTAAKRSGVPMWAWLAGGGVVALLVLAVAGAGIGALVFFGGDRNKDKNHQAKVDDGKKLPKDDGKPKPPPVKPLVDPDKDKVPGKLVVDPPDKDKENGKVKFVPPNPPAFKNNQGMEFVRIPKGKAWIGGSDGKPGDNEIEIAQDFYLGVYEVTQEEWQKVMQSNPSKHTAVPGVSKEDHMRFPVEHVSWDDAQKFLAKLNELDKQPRWEYRLPKDVEWEYACRGGPMADKSVGGFNFYFDKPTLQLLPNQANIQRPGGLNRPCKVGSFAPNALGLYDMHGNVWEWCHDSQANRAPLRIIRGGSWTATSEGCTAASRPDRPPNFPNHDAGIRVARVPIAPVVPVAKAGDFVPLFNGKDLTGWKPPVFPGKWTVKDGILTGVAAPSLISTSTYRDFHLRLEGRIGDKSMANIIFRGPESVPQVGYIATVNANSSSLARTGSLDFFKLGSNGSIISFQAALHKPGEWFEMEIIALKNHITIKVNGQKTVDIDELKHPEFTGGPIVLGTHPQSTVEFKKIEIKELKAEVAPPIAKDGDFVSIFNNKDLTGWAMRPQDKDDWRVVDGVLVGSAQKNNSTLHTIRSDYKDVHVRIEARYAAGTKANLYVRAPINPSTTGARPGLHAHIRDHKDSKDFATGALSMHTVAGGGGTTGPRISTTTTDKWFVLELIANGNRVIVMVDGKPAGTQNDVSKYPGSGMIALQLELKGVPLEVRKIEVKELSAPAVAPLPPAANAAGFVPLFNGKDLAGWKANVTKSAYWQVKDSILTGAGPGASDLYTLRDDYANFHLRVEMRLNENVGSLVYCRAPEEPKPGQQRPGVAARVTLAPKSAYQSGTLHIYDAKGARTIANKTPNIVAGQWFLLELIASDNQVVAKIDGKQTAVLPDKDHEYRRGRFILTAATPQAVLEFRKIEIKELPAPAVAPAPPAKDEGFVSLFNGKDLTGWKPSRTFVPGTWRVEDSVLVGASDDKKGGMIQTAQPLPRDFHLRVELRVAAKTGIIWFRSPENDPGGYESRLSTSADGVKVGDLRAQLAGSNVPVGRSMRVVPTNQWFTLEIIANEKRLTLKVDGAVTTDVEDDKVLTAGHLKLMHIPGARFEYRKIEIKELKAR